MGWWYLCIRNIYHVIYYKHITYFNHNNWKKRGPGFEKEQEEVQGKAYRRDWKEESEGEMMDLHYNLKYNKIVCPHVFRTHLELIYIFK